MLKITRGADFTTFWAKCQELFKFCGNLKDLPSLSQFSEVFQGFQKKVLDISRPRPARESFFAFPTNQNLILDNYPKIWHNIFSKFGK